MSLPQDQAAWLKDMLADSRLGKERGGIYPSWRDIRRTFPGAAADLTSFIQQTSWQKIRSAGLLLV
jgi:hypothetical protein